MFFFLENTLFYLRLKPHTYEENKHELIEVWDNMCFIRLKLISYKSAYLH